MLESISNNLSIVIVIEIIGILISVGVYFKNPKSKPVKFFSLMTFCILLWVILGYLSHTIWFSMFNLFLYRLNLTVVCLFFIFAYYFSIYFPRENKRDMALDRIVIYSEIIIAFMMLFTDMIIKDVVFTDWGVNFILGDESFIFYTMVYFVTGLVFYNFYRKYFILSKRDKLKAFYFLIGITIFALMNLIFNVTYPITLGLFRYYWIGDYSTIVLLIFAAYAITKHELMGIKTLFTQVLIIVMSVILIIDIFLLSDNLTMQLLKMVVLITFLYFSRELVKSVRKEKEARGELEKAYGKINGYVKQLEAMNTDLAERNEDLRTLLETSGKASEALDSKKIAQDIVDSIPKNLKHLGYLGGVIVLYDNKKKLISTYAITESKIVEKAKSFLKTTFDKHEQNIENVDNYLIKTILEKKIFTGDNLADFIAPTVNKNICALIQKTVRAKSFISIPLISRGRAMGAILFVGKKEIKKIIQRDRDMLYMFSSHVGAAIENAKLYEQTSNQMKELAKLNESLESANENLKEVLEVKNEFLHITSHQLRTPLTAIRGMLSMWYEGDFDNLPESERKKILKRIYLSAERLNNITNDMLDALEIEGGLLKFQFTDASVKEIIKETIDTLKPNYDEKGIYVKFLPEKDVPETIKVEPNYIRQVFMNVIDNACKYTREGGVEIFLKNNGKYVDIVVKDTGVGVSEEDQKRLFEKFTRGKNAIKENASGSGLGLFIAKKIVEKHHGKMKFASEGVGKGSTVTISLVAKR